MKLERYHGNPILSPSLVNPWESLVTTNPAAWYDAEKGEVLLLYRACDDDAGHRICLGLATSRDGYTFTRVSDKPVFAPSVDGFDAGCVEDPRMVKVGEWFYITYACRALPPGQYWKPAEERKYLFYSGPDDFPAAVRQNLTATGLLLTKDFRSFIRAGTMTDPRLDDRDCYLFPEKIQGRWWRIHRPVGGVGADADGLGGSAIRIGWADDLLVWPESRVLIRPKHAWEGGHIGGNTPPVRTAAGWLTIYHAKGDDAHYRLGALLLDLEDPTRVIGRSRDWLIQPEEPYETRGCYQGGVIFPCGKVVIDGTLFVYYGGADKYVGLATCRLQDLVDDLVAAGA